MLSIPIKPMPHHIGPSLHHNALVSPHPPLSLFPSCPRENRQLAVSLADLMIKWEVHGRERTQARRAAAAAAAAATTPVIPAPYTASMETADSSAGGGGGKGTKRPLESAENIVGGGVSGIVSLGVGGNVGGILPGTAVVSGQLGQGREKIMRTETGGAPGTGAVVAVSAAAGGGVGISEGTTDNFTLNRSSVRQGFKGKERAGEWKRGRKG